MRGADNRMELVDPYRVLQVAPQAEQEVIQAAYRALALKYHPDRDRTTYAQRRMLKINAAYALLRDEEARAEWDRSQPTLRDQSQAAAAVADRAWRFVGEMEEIGSTFAAAGLPDGFALAARDLYRRLDRFRTEPGRPDLDEVLAEVRRVDRGG